MASVRIILKRLGRLFDSRPTFEELQEEITEWGFRTFPTVRPQGVIEHIRREVEELQKDPYESEEMADIIVLLIHLAAFYHVDLVDSLYTKHQVNKKRKWGKPDAQGVVEHIRD